jgi:hypothetical protein
MELAMKDKKRWSNVKSSAELAEALHELALKEYPKSECAKKAA